MIDFENTRSRGLQGAEYLQADDSVTIFYSQACMKIEQGRLEELKKSGCSFELCKLLRSSKNALDFYIASRIGEIYGRGYTGRIAIVSNDTGFQAVKDYWKSCASVSREIILRSDIEKSIFSSGENSFRQKQIGLKKKEMHLEEEYKKYAEQQRIRKALEDSFVNTDYEELIEHIMGIIVSPKSLKSLYLESIKQFGRRDGLKIYHKIRQIV